MKKFRFEQCQDSCYNFFFEDTDKDVPYHIGDFVCLVRQSLASVLETPVSPIYRILEFGTEQNGVLFNKLTPRDVGNGFHMVWAKLENINTGGTQMQSLSLIYHAYKDGEKEKEDIIRYQYLLI